MWIKDGNSNTWVRFDRALSISASSTGLVHVGLVDGSTQGVRAFSTEAEAVEWVENLLKNVKGGLTHE